MPEPHANDSLAPPSPRLPHPRPWTDAIVQSFSEALLQPMTPRSRPPGTQGRKEARCAPFTMLLPPFFVIPYAISRNGSKR